MPLRILWKARWYQVVFNDYDSFILHLVNWWTDGLFGLGTLCWSPFVVWPWSRFKSFWVPEYGRSRTRVVSLLRVSLARQRYPLVGQRFPANFRGDTRNVHCGNQFIPYEDTLSLGEWFTNTRYLLNPNKLKRALKKQNNCCWFGRAQINGTQFDQQNIRIAFA